MYSTLEKVLLLRNAPLFERVAGEDLAPLARVAEPETFAKGDTIFRTGDHGDSLYVVIRGKVVVSRDERPIAHLGPGDAFGEMAVLDAGPRSATVLAEEETEVLRIGSEEFYEVLQEQTELADGVIRVVTQRLRGAASPVESARQSSLLP